MVIISALLKISRVATTYGRIRYTNEFWQLVGQNILTTDLNWRFKLEEVRLADEELARLRAEMLDVVLGELDILAGFLSAYLEQFSDHTIDPFVTDLHVCHLNIINK